MELASRITRLPHPFEPDRGAEARAACPEAEGYLARLIEGAAGCSPHLLALIHKEGDWLPAAFADPEGAVAAETARLDTLAPDALGAELRRAKRRVALTIALADLAGAWSLEEVTGTLTRFADHAVGLGLRAGLAAELRRGRLPGQDEAALAEGCGAFALAMGKMGAHELNYSSDIDLICLFDEGRYENGEVQEARAGLVRAVRRMTALLAEQTEEGYVFRTDLRLRPDPSVTPVILGMNVAESYYESLGRTWERAAYVKARPCAGDTAAGGRFLEALRPFVWRKHLDFAAIEDAHAMRLAIREHKGLFGPITLPGHDMKLGRGGIREIEFFTQTRQIIAGGRDPDLRVRGTVEGLRVLARKGWVPEETAEKLVAHYRAHREVEHRVQMLRDQQTHDLPRSDEGFARLAAFMGVEEEALRRDLFDRLTEVHALTEDFFAPDAARPAPEIPEIDTSITQRWPTYPALRSSRAVAIFERLKPDILARLSRTARPEEALAAFDGFLAGLPAGVQLFALFEANPHLIDLVVDIAGTAPALARYLSRHAGVFDAVIAGDFFEPLPDAEELTQTLAAQLAEAEDYERQLDTARRWAKEVHFRIGVHLLRGQIGCAEAGGHYADLAEACLRALWPAVVVEFARKHGDPPGRGAVVLGMGSLGARRMTSVSDLDLIVIYEAEGVEQSDGRRPLSARAYYARLTQALVTAMSAQTAEGRLYDVDMRLRPSGRQGPVATSRASFEAYQRREAWVWEHLALTRARPVAGGADLAQEVEAFRRTVLGRKDRDTVLREAAAMRARVRAAKTPEGPWDAKLGPGRLQDVDLVAQTGALLAAEPSRNAADGLAAAERAGLVDAEGYAALAEAERLLWQVQLASKLLSEGPLDADRIGEGGAAFLARLTGIEGLDALQARLDEVTARAAAVIDAALPEAEGAEK
ncbi:glutamine-synthetase adenylyltransferase [Rhodosalinus halophilus]|uniref:Glutamine-synthetase adenylyltransferase n=1 Tax=Rhodosalinus halophilus TaxID=2259333 RepID=A0A365UB59_9RHOB|nr:glutamine-synthetase adenylyltransferase [Rhodosalinus halophilus]RBI86539.1 glutamine-synthetase adenylyltransferase [Rhodosalinus halophilus]